MFIAARIAYILLIVIFKLMVLKLTFSVSGIIELVIFKLD